jgi:aryl-alcohol dehydrogenase-like predicted oxidoreductase
MATWTRRQFLGATAGLAALPIAEAAAQEPKIPRRALGKTGMQVSILGLGGGSQFLSACRTDDEAVELVNAAIDGGINYLDSAASYGNGESLRRYGLVVPRRRKEVYVTSKTQERGRDGAMREVELSLKNLGTDHLDLMQIHLIRPDEDLDRILAKDGVFPTLLNLKQQKVVRNVGITGHLAALNMKTLVGRMEGLDTVLCPVNPYKDSRHYIRERDENNPNGHFEQILLPAARKKGLGIIAMKTMAQGELIGQGPGKTTAANLLRWALSEPGVCVAIVGPGSRANLKQNLKTAQTFQPMPEAERKQLVLHLSGAANRFAYLEPHYQDG